MTETLPVKTSEYGAFIKRFPAYAGLVKKLLTEAKLTTKQKVVLGAGLGYLASPIDLVPGIIPVLGQLDDALVVLLCLRQVIRDHDEERIEGLLGDAGLTRQQIDDDIVLVKETIITIAKKTALVARKGLGRAGRAILGLIKTEKS